MRKSVHLLFICAFLVVSCKKEEPCLNEDTANQEVEVYGNDDTFDNCGNNDALCMCFAELSKSIRGLPLVGYNINQPWLMSSDDPEVFFKSGGSKNWPLICRTAKYYKDHDPTWLKRYFEVQKLGDTSVTFQGSEMFSGTYTSLVVGAIIAAMKHARDKGHDGLTSRGSDWLRAYWSYLALTANQRTEKTRRTINANGDNRFNVANIGYGTAIFGNRNYVNRNSGNGYQKNLLSMALEHPNRDVPGNLSINPGYYGGMRIASEALGYRLNSSGRVNLKSRSVPASHMGLSNDDRAKLKSFISTSGTKELQSVYSMIEGWPLKCTVTIMRTATGTITWMGDSQKSYATCALNKGGPLMAARFEVDKLEATFLSRTYLHNKPSDDMGEVWRQGDKICGQSQKLPKACIQIPSGDVVYEIRINKRGVTCVQGDCTIPEGPAPMMVELLYEGLLFRGSDAAGMEQWKDFLLGYSNPWDGYVPASNAFVTSGEFVDEIMNPASPRYQEKKTIAHRVYQTYLNRCANPGELQDFVAKLAAGNGAAAVKGVLSSSEFISNRDSIIDRGVPTYKECEDPICQ